MASTTVASNAIVLEVLDQHNYEDWSSRVETYLLGEDLWDVVNAKPPNRPQGLEGQAEYKAWTTKNAKALHAIKISCGTRLFSFIRETRTAKIAWELLEKKFKSLNTLRLEKKEREERERSLHRRPINVAGQTRDEGQELVQANEDLDIRASEGDLERETSLHIAMDARQIRGAVEELVPADDDEELPREGGNERIVNFEYDSSYNPFFNYVINGDWENAKECLATLHLEDAVRARFPDKGCTALHLAAWKGHVHIIKELTSLMTQEDLEIKDNHGCTALHKAVYQGNVDIVKELLSSMREEALEIKDNDDYTALHEAVYHGNVDIVKELASLMRRVRRQGLVMKNNSGDTAFHMAAMNGNADIVKELVLYISEEDLKVPNAYGCNVLHVAALNGHVHIVKELLLVMTQEDLKIKETTNGHTALHKAVLKENVDIVKDLLAVMRQEDLEVKDSYGCTALHRAVMNGNVDRAPNLISQASEISEPALNVDIVKELVRCLREKALEIEDDYGFTPLGRAIKRHRVGDQGNVIKMTEHMIRKNPKILSNVIPPQNLIPVVEACVWERWELARYLYSVTPLEALVPPNNGLHGASLIWFCLKAKEFDIAWDLLLRCPSLTIVETVSTMGSSPIVLLSRVHSAFLRDLRLRFWQKWIYEYFIRLRRPNKYLLERLGINELKSTHDRILEFIGCMGKATINMEELTLAQLNMLNKSMFEAIEQGNVEFVTHMCKANPNLVNMLGDKQKSIFHYAIECRQEKIYSLIYGLKEEERNVFGIIVASFDNTMLHGTGNLSPLPQFNHIQGASLQMQRELQWFKEVESVVPIGLHESRNFSDNLTARELFHKNHKKLMEEAELSMKGTATSCTFVGALIITIMFAAAFTIPGGNNVKTGLPMFIDENLFLVFIVSDTTALVSSITAVIIFLGILTSRYSEDDYLKNLPTKMMIGLFSLFISIATMMITFCCGLVIMLHERYSWVAIPSILVASIPIISFVCMLFPLLFRTFISTYGPGIFNKKIKPWY